MGLNKREITLKQKNLLLHSKITQQHPEFYNFLKENKNNDITEELINQTSLELQDFIEYILPNIKIKAKEEWTAEEEDFKDLEQNRTTCSLCDNPNVRYVFYVTNTFTKEKLKVGSTCITHFGVELAADPQILIENMKRSTRLRKLNKLIPGIQQKIDNWLSKLKKYKIIIPENLSQPYQANAKEARETYNKFLDNQLPLKEAIIRLKHLLRKKEGEITIKNIIKNKPKECYI